MSAIGKGDWVTPLRDVTPPVENLIPVHRGGAYRVTMIEDRPGLCGGCGQVRFGLYLLGDRRHPIFARCPCDYRLIYRPREGAFDHLLAPAPELETA